MIRSVQPVNQRKSSAPACLQRVRSENLVCRGLPEPLTVSIGVGYVDTANFHAGNIDVMPDPGPARRTYCLVRLQRPLETQSDEALVARERLRDTAVIVVFDDKQIDMFVGLVGRPTAPLESGAVVSMKPTNAGLFSRLAFSSAARSGPFSARWAVPPQPGITLAIATHAKTASL
jgi:hypothetical protein